MKASAECLNESLDEEFYIGELDNIDGNKIDHSILQFEMSRKQSITNTDMMNQVEKYIERK